MTKTLPTIKQRFDRVLREAPVVDIPRAGEFSCHGRLGSAKDADSAYGCVEGNGVSAPAPSAGDFYCARCGGWIDPNSDGAPVTIPDGKPRHLDCALANMPEACPLF